MDAILKNKDLIQFIKKQSQSASWMASNCSGAFLLGEAGVLDGKNATTWAGGEKDLSKAYPKIKVQYDQNVVIDGKVITSNGGPACKLSGCICITGKVKFREIFKRNFRSHPV